MEMALVFPIVIMLLFGVAEFGLAFKNFLSISHGSREGALVSATSGNDVQADFASVEAVLDALTAVNIDEVQSIVIRNPDSPFESTSYNYTPGGLCDWTPCPDFFAGAAPGDPPYSQPGYVPSDRDVSAPQPGRVEVVITYTHNWITGLWAQQSTWTSATTMRIEPRIFDAVP